MNCAAPSVNFCGDEVHTPEPLVSRSAAREKVRDALRLHVGRGRRFSVKQLSECAGVPARAIEAAMCPIDDENYRPLTLENLFCIAKFLKAPFVSHYLELCGLGAFELMDGQIPLPKMLASAEPSESPTDRVRRLSRELVQALEDCE
jgi:hypothetical protein